MNTKRECPGLSDGIFPNSALYLLSGLFVILILLHFLYVFIIPFKRFLGDYADGGFTDMAAREAILRFQGKLNRISRSIKLRNESLEVPYTYLLPERVPNGIGI